MKVFIEQPNDEQVVVRLAPPPGDIMADKAFYLEEGDTELGYTWAEFVAIGEGEHEIDER